MNECTFSYNYVNEMFDYVFFNLVSTYVHTKKELTHIYIILSLLKLSQFIGYTCIRKEEEKKIFSIVG